MPKTSFFSTLHIVKRDQLPLWKGLVIRALAILIAAVFTGLLTYLLTGIGALDFYETLLDGALGTSRRLWGMLQNTAILLCIALALTPAFKMRFWNTGAEGQVLMGGLATATCMIFLADKLPGPLLMIAMFLSALLIGAIWAGLPAYFKAKWNTNETLFTLMMNYVAMQIISYFTLEWSVPKGSGQIGVINQQSQLGWIPSVGRNPYLINILLVLLLTVLVYFYLRQTKQGYELTVVGESMNTARYIGLPVSKIIIRTLLLSGALCGLAGFLLVAGADHTISSNTAGGRGFTAILVAWMGKFNPFYMILTSLLLAFFEKGAFEISTIYKLNASYADIVTGIIIFFIIGFEFFLHYQIQSRKTMVEEEEAKVREKAKQQPQKEARHDS